MTSDSGLSRDIPSILIVDDTLANLELLAGMLRDRGYEPRPVPSGKLALAAVQADPPDMILLDIRMPEMSGFEVYERLKADKSLKDIPVIFITALTETADKVKAFSMGAVDYITKPFQLEEIDARVQTHLRIRSLQNQLLAQNENLERLVEKRTQQLVKAYERLLELDRIKDDFLRMISHELRTPAHGVLSMGELILDLCPPSNENTHYSELFKKSSARLRNLIEDATLIADIEKHPLKSTGRSTFSAIFDKLRISLPDIKVLLTPQIDIKPILLLGNSALLERALETAILLASSFSKNKQTVCARWFEEGVFLKIRFDLDALPLSEMTIASFFEMESLDRATSPAEMLGLAPVVAQKIISAFGGEMKLVKGNENSGYLETVLLKEPDPAA